MVVINIHRSYTVTPSETTPTSTHYLSLCDQIKLPNHGSQLYLYSNRNSNSNSNNHDHTINILRTSLAKTLTHYYPFAGRLTSTDGGRFKLLCNAKGANLLEATCEVCFNKTITHGTAVWNESSLGTTLPTFILNLALILFLNRIFLLLSEIINVPRVAANTFTGFLLGGSVLGRWEYFSQNILFPYYNLMPLETVGALILVYYVFLVGLEVDIKPMIRCYNKKAMAVAICGIIFTFPIGICLYYLLVTDIGRIVLLPQTKDKHFRGALFWGLTLSCSSEFPEIAKILSDLKLLLTDNGQLALTSSLINDLFSWTLLFLVLTQFSYHSILSVIIALLVVLASFYVLYPLLKWLIQAIGTRDRELLDTQVVILLHIVLVIGIISDGFGAHSIIGAFFFGAIIPKGVLNNAIHDKVFDFVSTFMMPLFFLIIGERTNIQDMALNVHWGTIAIIVVVAFMAKMVSTVGVCWIYQMPLMEALSLALLMNTKGTMPLIILYTACARLEIDSQGFTVMLVACWLMTAIAGPVLASLTKTVTTGKNLGSKHKIMEGPRPDSLLRVLACVHSKRDANAIINLLKASSPSVRTPVQVLAVELIKMTNRPTSSLIIREARKPTFHSSSSKVHGFKKDNIDNLESFDNLNQAIFADKLRIISNYNSMHEDIINVSTRKNANLILTTFYKQPTYVGLGAGTATARAVNIINRDHASKDEKKVVLENLVKESPCSLAILVDREFGHKHSKEMRIAMFYVSGADDREALSYAWRMSRNADVVLHLTVVRLVWENSDDEFDERDRFYLSTFVHQTVDMRRVRYLEKVVRDEKETVSLLNRVGNKGFDLFVIGRGQGRKMSLAQTLDPVLEEPALGPLGDALADLNSAAHTSILIIQSGEGEDNLEKHEQNVSVSVKVCDSMMQQQMMVPQPGMVVSHYT